MQWDSVNRLTYDQTNKNVENRNKANRLRDLDDKTRKQTQKLKKKLVLKFTNLIGTFNLKYYSYIYLNKWRTRLKILNGSWVV